MALEKMELRALINYCWGKTLSSRDAAKEIDDVKETYQEFFHSKEPEWHFRQIRKLADRW